jgi:aminoglycoside/choline kinase family phosphotransferase
MPASLDDLKTLAGRCLGIPVRVLGRLPGGGSERAFHRLQAAGRPAIGVIGANLAEVRAFLGFTRHFAQQGIPVPRILGEDAARGLYLMEDLGQATLAGRLREWRAAPDGAARARAALEAVVRWLPEIQVRGGAGLDDTLCWEGRALDGAAFARDVERFLTQYVPRFVLRPTPVDAAVRADLDALLERLDALPRQHFCYRDFQTRNVMWVAREGSPEGPVFLDYQAGRRGPLAYDLASLLFSPDTGADEPLREHLLGVYLAALAGQGVAAPREAFLAGFWPLVLVRRLQALGRYAELIAVRKRAGFLEKIAPALAELRALHGAGRFAFGLPALEAWLGRVLEA